MALPPPLTSAGAPSGGGGGGAGGGSESPGGGGGGGGGGASAGGGGGGGGGAEGGGGGGFPGGGGPEGGGGGAAPACDVGVGSGTTDGKSGIFPPNTEGAIDGPRSALYMTSSATPVNNNQSTESTDGNVFCKIKKITLNSCVTLVSYIANNMDLDQTAPIGGV